MANANIDALYAGSLRLKNILFLFIVILHSISGALRSNQSGLTVHAFCLFMAGVGH